MSKDKGKAFEKIVFDAFNAMPDVSIDRIPDQTMRYKDRKNVSDFIMFSFPYQYYIECKTVHGNRLPFSNISQFDSLLEKSKILGVRAGVMCWWVDKDVTRWIPIEDLDVMRACEKKSVSYKDDLIFGIEIKGRKKKVYFEYDFTEFLEKGGYKREQSNDRRIN